MNSQSKEDTFEVTGPRILEAIKQGCLKRTSCSVTIEGDSKEGRPSMLLHTDKPTLDAERILLIAVPAGAAKPKDDDQIEVRFEYDGRSLIFYSKYSNEESYTTRDEMVVDCWRIEFPETMHQIQRRAFFRVRACVNEPIHLEMTMTGASEDVVDEDGSSVSRRNAVVSEQSAPEPGETIGILWDISAGGLSYTLDPEPPFQVAAGAEIELEMCLPGIRDKLFFKGKVVGRKLDESGHTVYSVEYTDMDSSARLRRSHNIALQYIAKRERSLLKDLRMAKRWR